VVEATHQSMGQKIAELTVTTHLLPVQY
jgi:hypothetical protein